MQRGSLSSSWSSFFAKIFLPFATLFRLNILLLDYLLDAFLTIHKIITTIITIMIIPTQTPALKIVPIAWQLFKKSTRRRHNGINLLNVILFIINGFTYSILLFQYPFLFFLFALQASEACFLFPSL